jgi:hypothetical protein
MLPLKPCLCPLHRINLSPFVINGKGIFPSGAAPLERLSSYGASSCTSKTYKIRIQKEFIFGVVDEFCKDVFHMFFCAHILNSDVLFCNLFP